MAHTSTTVSSSTYSEAQVAPSLSKAERKQHERTASGIAFLNHVEKISVTGTKWYDEREHVLFDVVVKNHDKHAALLNSEKAILKEAKKIQPTVNYSNMKALSTLHGVHKAVVDWSSKHSAAGSEACAYCSQFNSPDALELWAFNDHDVKDKAARAALTATATHAVLRQLEKCLNSYLECARNVPDGLSERDCEGLAHIPLMVTSFVQNESYNSVALDIAVLKCQIM